ncbi:unnamed protein product [Durusdinium trenchii]|uniref:Uncharacterized protein n=1 Tax=Durusdinium trenchii TaxID=1381693 RepID=A0ABP0K0J2_9DINO
MNAFALSGSSGCTANPVPVRIGFTGRCQLAGHAPARRAEGRRSTFLALAILWKSSRRRLNAARSSGKGAGELVEQVRDTLRRYGQPLQLSVLGSAVDWTAEQRAKYGRLASFLRRQPELWLSGGFVGETTLRDWHPRERCPPRPLHELRVLEFFSGIGGFRAAFQQACGLAGHDGDSMSEWVNVESSPLANEVYSCNFNVPYGPLLPKDIRRVAKSEVEGADLWLMSPPCQPYTRMGLRRDLEDGRAKPLQHLAQLLPTLERPPEAVLLENVVGFENSASFELISEALCRAGLEVRHFSLSPLQLGIPNRRPRIYLMAFQSEQPRVHPLETEFPGLLESPENRQLSEYLQLQKEHQSVPERLLDLLWEKGQRWEVVTPNSTSSSTFTSGYTTPCFDAHRFGPLLATDAEGHPELEPRHLPGGRVQRLVAPGEDVRYFTPLELLQIHGFPKSFHFPETVTEHQRYKLIGDSISVDVVAELLRYLLFEKIKAASS